MNHPRPVRSRLTCLRPSIVLVGLLLSGPPIQAEEPPPSIYHEASLSQNTVAFPALPDVLLQLSPEFTYLGSTGFALEGRTQVDVHVFAEMTDNSIHRLVKVQIETLIDDDANDFHWAGVDTVQIQGADYFVGYWCFDAAEVAKERPDSDTAKTQAWLASIGYQQPGVFVGTRMARVFNTGRSELLVFYGEAAKITGIDCEDENTAMTHLPAIIERSDNAYAFAPPGSNE